MQLTFQPAFDSFHAVFRFLRLRGTISEYGPLHRDQVRILDFYLLFPTQIQNIRLAPRHRKYKRLSTDYVSMHPYGELPADQLVFARMEPMQDVAFNTLAAHKLIDPEKLKEGRVAVTDVPLVDELGHRVEAKNDDQASLMEFIKVLASEYGLGGSDGLKSRTGLLEHRYDAI